MIEKFSKISKSNFAGTPVCFLGRVGTIGFLEKIVPKPHIFEAIYSPNPLPYPENSHSCQIGRLDFFRKSDKMLSMNDLRQFSAFGTKLAVMFYKRIKLLTKFSKGVPKRVEKTLF